MTRRLHDQRTGIDCLREPDPASRLTDRANKGHRHHRHDSNADGAESSNHRSHARPWSPGNRDLVRCVSGCPDTATINLWLARRKSREDERNRLRNSFAEAFAAYSAYKEFPYAIRRRRADAPAEERIRLSGALREIQANLAYHLA